MLVTKFINAQMKKIEQFSYLGYVHPEHSSLCSFFFQQIIFEHLLFARGPAWRRHGPSLRMKSFCRSLARLI